MTEENRCPQCGTEFDPEQDEILECPECGKEGSTKCCMLGGAGVCCVECDQEEDEDD